MVSARELERMMKLQDVIFKRDGETDHLDGGDGDRRYLRPNHAEYPAIG